MFTNVSVWWHVIGVLVIIVLLIAVPSHHQSFSFVFGHRINNSGFSHNMYWFYVLPLGFLLTMYTITGYDASAHISEETHGAAMAAPKGVWRSVFYSAIFGWMVLLALTFAATNVKAHQRRRRHLAVDHRDRAHLGSGEGGPRHLDGRPDLLRDGLRHERVADDVRVLPRRRGPGPQPVARLGKNKTPTWAVVFVARVRADHHDPGVQGQPRRAPGGIPRGHLDLGDRALHRVHHSRVPALADARQVRGRAVDARGQVQVDQPDRDRLGRAVRDHLLVCRSRRPRVPFSSSFSWSAFNYAPLITIVVIAAVTIWYCTSAHKTFKGPIRTSTSAARAARSASHAEPASAS